MTRQTRPFPAPQTKRLRKASALLLGTALCGLGWSQSHAFPLNNDGLPTFECGSDQPGGDTITCSSDNYYEDKPNDPNAVGYPNFPDGITNGGTDGLTLILDDPEITVGDEGVSVQLGAGRSVNVSDVSVIAKNFASITTDGAVKQGILAAALGGGDVDLLAQMDAGEIVTKQGNFSSGLQAWMSDARDDDGDGNSNTVDAERNVTARMTGGSIRTEGAKSVGINATNIASQGNTLVDMQAGSVETLGSESHGIFADQRNEDAEGSVSVKVSGGSIVTTSADASGVVLLNAGKGSSTIDISGNTSISGGGAGIVASNASSEDTTITIADGSSVSTSGTTAQNFAIWAIAPNGAVIVDNSGTVTGPVNLTNSNTFTNSGTWDLAGTTSDFNANGDSLVVNEGLILAARDSAAAETSAIDNLDRFRNAGGTIRLADGAVGDLLLINGNGTTGEVGRGAGTFVTNGGSIELDVDLSGTELPDFVGINGNLRLGDAPTALSINPVGDTTGDEAADSVQIVRVGTGNGETSEDGAFVLAGPVEVGAIAYDLSLGDCTDQADANWYLCNTIGSTGAVFEAMPGVILDGVGRRESLSDRLGARITSRGMTASTQGAAAPAAAVGPWFRSWGSETDLTPENSTAAASWSSDSRGFEFGLGAPLGAHAGGDLIATVSLRDSSVAADIENPGGVGHIDTEGQGLGLALTWFGHNGLYVDLAAARDWISVDARSSGGGELLKGHDDVVSSASGEIGQRFALENGMTLVPQAQLSWSRMQDGSFEDALGNSVRFEDAEQVTGRLGLTVEQTVDDPRWGNGKIYGFGNLLHDFDAEQDVRVAGTALSQESGGSWAELGAGISIEAGETGAFYGQVSYQSAIGDLDGDAMALSGGWRVQW